MFIATETKGWSKEFVDNGWCLVDTVDGDMVLICHGTDEGHIYDPLCYAIALGNQIKGIICCYPARIAANHPEISHLILGNWYGITVVKKTDNGISFIEKEEEECYVPSWD